MSWTTEHEHEPRHLDDEDEDIVFVYDAVDPSVEATDTEKKPASPEMVPNADICIRYIACGKDMLVNQNVLLILTVYFLYGLTDSLMKESAYAAYVNILGHDKNGPLGVIEAVYGLTALLSAPFVGYLADRCGRSKIIRAGGVLTFLAIVMQLSLMAWIGTNETVVRSTNQITSLAVMGLIMIFWGVAECVLNGPASALLAESTPSSQRSIYFTYLYSIYTLASSSGPLVALVMFQTMGDEWTLRDLASVIYAGLGIAVIYCILMLLVDDAKALHGGDEEFTKADEETAEKIATDGDEKDNDAAELTEVRPPSMSESLLIQRQRWIPYIVLAQGLITAAGTGISVKFFPLFFKDEASLLPSQVQVVYVAIPITTVIFSFSIASLADRGFGRVQATAICSVLSVALMLMIVFFRSAFVHYPVLLIAIYVLQRSFLDCSFPLQESILLDYAPRGQSARWASMFNVSSFGWCGSAALGGWLSDKYGYSCIFLLTALIQCMGIVVWCFLLPLVPRNQSDSPDEKEEIITEG